MTEAPLLEARNLGVDVRGRALVRGVNFALVAGQKLAIVGPSGSGKSQLLRTIVGLQDAAEGTVLYRGGDRDVDGWPRFRRRVLLVPTRVPLLPGTVADNFAIVGSFASHNAGIQADRRDELLAELGVDGLLDRDTAVLSTGEQRRVAIARALAMQPDVLVVDEPTNGLDAEHAETVARLLAAAGGVIIVSHDRALVERLADAVVDLSAHVIGGGNVVARGAHG